MNTNNIQSVFTQGMAFEHSINSHKIISDTGPDDGGNNFGPGPKRLMLASLAGCTGIDVVDILNKMKVPFSKFSIDTAGTLSETSPQTYTAVKITYSIKVAEDNRSKMERAVQLSEEKYCGVMMMFKAFAAVTHEIIFL